MHLHLERDQHTRYFGSIEYILHVELLSTPEELQLITEHRLDRKQLFSIPEQHDHQQSADAAFERADNRRLFDANAAGKMFADHLAGLYHLYRAATAYRVTVADAIAGTTIRCPDLYELLEAEQHITNNFDELYSDLNNALAFAIGREQLLVPDGVEETDDPPPAAWPHQHPGWRHR